MKRHRWKAKLHVGEEWPGDLTASVSPTATRTSITRGVIVLAAVLVLLLTANALWTADEGTLDKLLTWATNLISAAFAWALRGAVERPP